MEFVGCYVGDSQTFKRERYLETHFASTYFGFCCVNDVASVVDLMNEPQLCPLHSHMHAWINWTSAQSVCRL